MAERAASSATSPPPAAPGTAPSPPTPPQPPGPGPLRAAAFLDRDGTLIAERRYLADPAGVALLPGTIDGLRSLRAAGFALVVVTNQSGIARGYYDVRAFEAVQRRLEEILADHGIALDGVYYCPHHPDVSGPCDCRKPATGLYRRAAAELGLDLRRSLFIGDKLEDVIPAAAFAAAGILVRTGYGAEVAFRAPAGVRVVERLGALAGDPPMPGLQPAPEPPSAD